jgi:hypothetical protein
VRRLQDDCVEVDVLWVMADRLSETGQRAGAAKTTFQARNERHSLKHDTRGSPWIQISVAQKL